MHDYRLEQARRLLQDSRFNVFDEFNEARELTRLEYGTDERFQRFFTNAEAIAYKKILESRYWLSLLSNEYIDRKTDQSIEADAEEITKILYSIIRTSKVARN